MSNKECPISKCGNAMRCSFYKYQNGRIPYLDIENWILIFDAFRSAVGVLTLKWRLTRIGQIDYGPAD